MSKNINLTLFAAFMIATGGMMTACNNKPKDDKIEIQQVDTPPALTRPEDGVKQPEDTISPDTTKTKMKDQAPKKKPLTLTIDNLASPTATIEVSVYTPQNKFPTENGQFKKYRFKPKAGKLVATITDLDYGEYAVATFQDLDEDGKIAKNMIGIPTDPYGFSNNYRPRIKAPAFKDCKFDYDAATASINISMIKK
jgi:uncharacterized protein (DUF2141 family)